MVVLPAADQVPSGRNGLDLEPDSSLQAGGVDHEATPLPCERRLTPVESGPVPMIIEAVAVCQTAPNRDVH